MVLGVVIVVVIGLAGIGVGTWVGTGVTAVLGGSEGVAGTVTVRAGTGLVPVVVVTGEVGAGLTAVLEGGVGDCLAVVVGGEVGTGLIVDVVVETLAAGAGDGLVIEMEAGEEEATEGAADVAVRVLNGVGVAT